MKKHAFAAVSLAFVLTAGAAAAQTGIVTGSVHDQKTGEDLIGANVLLVGTSLGASADVEGKYTIRNVPPGTYQLRISYVGYAPKLVQGVVVAAGQTAQYDVSLGQVVEEAKEEVVVSAQRVLATEAAVLAERQKAATIGDAVSAEQIKRSPDATSGDAIKRVTGVTITNDKFVFIRGVTDRYNGTELNGVSVTSTDTDVDRKSFSFDMVPANLLENTVVVKTASPDLPGDFSGGLVQVNTLDFPARRTLRVGLSSAYDRATTTESMYTGQGGGHDWTGRDDGSRALPPGNLQGNALASALPNTWELQERKAPFDKSFGVSFGDRRAVGGDELGLIGALSYRTTFETNEFTQRPSYQDVPLFSFDGERYHRKVLWGGLLNLNYKLRTHHKFSFRNNYVQSADEKVNLAAGLPSSGEYSKKQTEEWDQRYFYLTQLGGEHQLPALAGLQVEWKGFYSRSQAEEPDRKQVSYELGSGNAYSLKENYRTWSDLTEESRGGNLDVTKPWKSLKLKAGTLFDRRTRDYAIQAYASDPSNLSPPNYGLVALPIGQIFAPENYGPGKFNFIPITVFTGEYSGRHDLVAGYGMADVQRPVAGLQLRLVGGVRVEDSDIQVHSVAQTGDPRPVTTELTATDWLPSANLTWKARDTANLRLAYGRSLNRPEFRELADVLYYDFDNEQNVQGNARLQRALIDNYDVRAEWFPHVGEVLAASYFYKHLRDAIEEELIPSPERYVRTWFNSPQGENHGIELEARKSMGFLWSPLQDLSVTGNYTRVLSRIEYTESRTDALGNAIVTQEHRVMQGQAPWTVNLALQFNAARTGTSASVYYGKVGRRLDAVGDTRDEDVYEESRNLLDLSATQHFLSRWEAKLAIKNLLAEDERLTIGPERSTFARLTKQREYSFYLAMGL